MTLCCAGLRIFFHWHRRTRATGRVPSIVGGEATLSVDALPACRAALGTLQPARSLCAVRQHSHPATNGTWQSARRRRPLGVGGVSFWGVITDYYGNTTEMLRAPSAIRLTVTSGYSQHLRVLLSVGPRASATEVCVTTRRSEYLVTTARSGGFAASFLVAWKLIIIIRNQKPLGSQPLGIKTH